MKYCSKCGASNQDDARFCEKCGHEFDKPIEGEVVDKNKKSSTSTYEILTIIVFVLMIIGTVTLGFALIPLIWCIPMTIHYNNLRENKEKPSLAFAICSLIFVSVFAGVIMIIQATMDVDQ